MTPQLPIYLDHHATTPIDPRVAQAMRPYEEDRFGNPGSPHRYGWEAEAAVAVAREQVARVIGAKPSEMIWTSGTTESNNLALIGAARAAKRSGNPRDTLLVSAIEHRSVLEAASALGREGFQIVSIPVDSSGRVDPEDIKARLTDRILLVSVMAANNEVGTIQPTTEIGRLCKSHGVLFHVDAAQACGKIPVDVEAMGIDLLSTSAHKVYGPKGIGILFVRSRNPHVSLEPLFYGGGQEKGLRPGTLPVPLIVGMGSAFEMAQKEMEEEGKRLLTLRRRLLDGLQKQVKSLEVNGTLGHRLSGNLNVSFGGVRSDALLAKLKNVAVSSGSACASESKEPSYVIRAMGLGDERAMTSIRFGMGRFNTLAEIDAAIREIIEVMRSIR